MSINVFDKNGNDTLLVEEDEIASIKNRFLGYDIYNNYEQLTDPVEGFKKIYNSLPSHDLPMFIFLYCGANYIAIAQKTSNNYGCAIIFGYSFNSPHYVRIVAGTWQTEIIL